MEINSKKTDAITIQMAPQLARKYRAASEDKRRKIQSLLNLKFRSAVRSQRSLPSFMDEVADRATGRGLTQQKLTRLLKEQPGRLL